MRRGELLKGWGIRVKEPRRSSTKSDEVGLSRMKFAGGYGQSLVSPVMVFGGILEALRYEQGEKVFEVGMSQTTVGD